MNQSQFFDMENMSFNMRGSRKFCKRGSNFDSYFVFLVDKRRDGLNTTISGDRWPTRKTPFKWRFAGVPMMAQH